MSDRYFRNDFPDYPDGAPNDVLPDDQDYLRAGLSLKDEIIQATWSRNCRKVRDPSLYTGTLGTAFLCFKSYEISRNKDDLELCLEIVGTCSAIADASMKDLVTFICGRAGIYSLGAVAAHYAGRSEQVQHYLMRLKEMAREDAIFDIVDMPDELLYGRSGFLWACLFVNKHIGDETIPLSLLGPIVSTSLAVGRRGAVNHKQCPLMYEWYGTQYWGAAHGLAGITFLLMHFPVRKEDQDDIKRTLHYMVANRFPSGNYPCAEGETQDKLIHWCHGAPGIVLTLCKAAQVFPSEGFKEAAINAGEVVWKRGLLRRVGICHGVSGNAYAFLALHRLTGDVKYLYRANMFAKFLLQNGRHLILSRQMHGGDRPYSLFEGLAGTACLWLDMARPENARFPAYEI